MNPKKLKLTTETLRSLETADLDGVAGGTLKTIIQLSKKACTSLLTEGCVESLKRCGGQSYDGDAGVSVGPNLCTA